MKIIPVETLDIPELKIYQSFRENAFRKDGSFIADSPNVIKLLLEAGVEVKSLLATPEYYDAHQEWLANYDIPIGYSAQRTIIEQIVGHRLHHNVMMHAIRPDETELDALGDQIIMLDEISKSDNVGAIARSAAALGIDSYLLPVRGPHPYSRRAVRISMGHIGKLKYHRYEDLKETIKELKELGYHIYAAEVTEDATPLAKVTPAEKWVLLMGHEQLGLDDETLSLCDEVLTIEMEPEIKSFNVAVAASIMMYRLIILTSF
jgi:tRNA G18 (ribose-2'-O)-methylase SpoU